MENTGPENSKAIHGGRIQGSEYIKGCCSVWEGIQSGTLGEVAMFCFLPG